jgi:glycosyltransferase involved in cell wall biosynthesis
MPLVSIIMPAYNAELTIHRSIQSVLNQSYDNWELLICNDSSTDGTSRIVTGYLNKDDRIRFFKNEYNKGAPGARNTLLKYASGEYIAFLDSDDVWYSNKLEIQINTMIKDNLLFSYSGIDLQVLSYIASYRVCNNLEYNDLAIFQLINQQSLDIDTVTEKFLTLHKRFSVSYFGSGNLDKHGRLKASEARVSAGILKNEPLIDILFKKILESYFDTTVLVCPMTLMTHDIDKVSYVENPLTLLKSIVGDVVKRKRFYPQRIAHFFTKRSAHSNVLKLFDDQFEHIFLLLPKRSELNSDYPISFFSKNLFFLKKSESRSSLFLRSN